MFTLWRKISAASNALRPFQGYIPACAFFPIELDIHVLSGCHAHLAHTSPIHGVPVKHRIEVIKQTCAGHEDFGALRFLGGSTVDAECAGNVLLLHQLLDRQRGPHRPGTDEVVAAAMTGGNTVLARLFFRNGLVAQVGQGVILEQDAEFRLAFSEFRDKRRGNARSFIAGDGEAVFL